MFVKPNTQTVVQRSAAQIVSGANGLVQMIANQGRVLHSLMFPPELSGPELHAHAQAVANELGPQGPVVFALHDLLITLQTNLVALGQEMAANGMPVDPTSVPAPSAGVPEELKPYQVVNGKLVFAQPQQ